MMRKNSISLLLFLFLTLPMAAQELQVKSMVSTPMDQTANLAENLHQDLNGDYGGLVKVRLAASGASFEGWVLKQEPRGEGEYWVFMAKGSSRLTVKVKDFLPLEVNFKDYDDCIIKSKQTYVLTITIPQTGAPQQHDDGMRYLSMTVEPKNCAVYIDGTQQIVENGEVIVSVPKGSHTYQVTAPGHAPKEGTVEVSDNNEPLVVRLVSTQATLNVECATKGAQVSVNGQVKGTTQWSGALAPGNYQIAVSCEGYRSVHQSVTLQKSENKKLTIPALEMITGRLNVVCRPIGSDVYVDGKRVGTSPNIFRDVQIGNRTVEVRKEGYQTLTKIVNIKENEQTDLSGTLTANATATTATSSGNSGISGSSSSSVSGPRETFTVKGVSFTMVRVDGGTFTMGGTSEQGSDAASDERPTHQVTLSTFSIGETEVTQALWKAVMGNNPSSYPGNDHPVESVSWNECQEFIKRLNQLTGKTFRLPTEAEWEYAARGGRSNTFKYAGSNDIGTVAWWGMWFGGNSSKTSHPVKTKKPNELGLYDMTGNVFEWCNDWDGRYSSEPQTNPQGPSTGSKR